MEWNQYLRVGSAGEDVWLLKRRLMELGCYEARVSAVTHTRFGTDTRRAVLTFQRANGLDADGVVGPLTWDALFAGTQAGEAINADAVSAEGIPQHIGSAARTAIHAALQNASATRRKIVLNALNFASDPAVPSDYPLSLYIRGANLYDTARKPYVITISRVESGAKRQPEYYDGGRKAFMCAAVRQNPSITGADCSGGVVGLMRHAGVVQASFDCSADGFASKSRSKRIEREALLPADLAHKSGHIGLYTGGGYVVEWVGGAYGCQLTRLSARRVWNFVKRRETTLGAWTGFYRSSYY